jgi:glycosyltransferase involved in cell wall biosynthesis
MVEDNWAIEAADIGCVLGNDFTVNTYRFAGKPIHRIPLSSASLFDWNDSKDFSACRNTFLWFGSGGFAHKGLDLVLDAFAELPHLKLIVCGPLDVEPRFVKAFDKQLFQLENIETIGWVDIDSAEFAAIANRTVATIYPSCSEGGGGSVITCMHAGLIPIVTHESSVDIDDFGTLLESADVESIRAAASEISMQDPEILASKAKRAWAFARANHTRDRFAENYDRFVTDIVIPEVESRRAGT